VTRRRMALACVLGLGLTSCSPRARSTARPEAEFLLVSDDSTAWVRTSADTVIVQRAPLQLATLGGRLVEIYVAEEPMDFSDASFLVGRIFRRDLVSGDSTLVFADSTVLREAIRFMRANPDAVRLDADEEPSPDVRAVEATITPLAVVGNTIGVDVHVDRTDGDLGTHDSYRATVDLERGTRLSLAAVLTPAAADSVLQRARSTFTDAIALAGRRAGPVGKAASRALAVLSLDSLSFALTRDGDSLAAQFLAHAEQPIDETRDTHRFSLEPLAVPSPPWWRNARQVLPAERPDSSVRFDAGELRLDVRYDEGEVATVVMRARSGAPRTVTRMHGPLRRAIAVGDSLITPRGQWQPALERAFRESGYYSDEVRAASLRNRARPTATRQAAL
jgi:hypothetical protein